MAQKQTEDYLVKATRDGFRRGGRAWTTAETRVSRKDFTSEQWAAIEAEPLLLVVLASGEKPQALKVAE